MVPPPDCAPGIWMLMPMRAAFFLIAVLSMTACSGGSSTTPTDPTPPVATPVPSPGPTPAPAGPPTITITANGMTPLELTINVGQKVTFVNNDVRAHDVVGG